MHDNPITMTAHTPPTIKIKFRSYLLPVLSLVLLGFQLFSPFKGWMILLTGFGGAWLLSYLWVRSLARGLHLVREMRFGWAQVGDSIQERFTLRNRGWAPALWIMVIDHSDMPGYKISAVIGVGNGERRHWFSRGSCARRGLFTLGPTSLETGDPFGIYRLRLDYQASFTMLVVPPVVHLPSIEIAPGGRAGEGRRFHRALEQTISAGSVREYIPGDDMRRLHWATTARRGEPYMRVFEHTPASDWWIVLDMDEKVQAGEGLNATDEHGVVLAASLASQGLRLGKAVGLVMHGQDLNWQRPAFGDLHRWEMLRALAHVRRGQTPLATLLERTRGALGQRTSLILITPSLDADWLRALGLLLRRDIIPTVLLLDASSFGGEGNVSFVEQMLAKQGVTFYRISADMLEQPENISHSPWQWQVTPMGRAILDASQKQPWRTLA